MNKSRLFAPSLDKKRSGSRRRGLARRVRKIPLSVECLEGRDLLAVAVSGGFSGLAFDFSQNATPPDTQVAVGPTAIGEAVNTNLEFFTKTGGTLFQGSFASLFGSVRVDASHSTLMSDPSIHYDADIGRFVVSILDLDMSVNQAYLDFALSTNNHPSQPSDFIAGQIRISENALAGSPNAGTRVWADFDRYGSSASAFVFTFNMFTFPIGSQSLYDHVQVLAISKSALLAANPSFVTNAVDLLGWDGTKIVHENLSPAEMQGEQPTDPMYFVEEASYGSATNSQLRVLKVADVLHATASSFQVFDVGVPAYTTNPLIDAAHPWNSGDANADAPQLGTTDQMQTNDTRILNVAWRRDTGGVEHLVATQTVGATLARARWYEFITSSAAPSLAQSGEVGAAGSASYYPSIAIAPNGNFGLDFLQSSANQFMSMYVAGRTPSDLPGTMQTPMLASAGQTGYTLSGLEGSPHRAGDYSGITVDIDSAGNPLNSFWSANEYTGANAAWATWLSNFSVTVNAPPVIDLNWSGGGIVAPATASTQSPISINRSYTISGAAVTTDFTISYYASTDATFGNADDVLLGSETITAAADKTLGSHAGTSPALTLANRGTYYLFAMLDSGGAILETNETNNVAQTPTQVVVSGPVLVDNGQAGYSEVGAGWTTFTGGFGGNFRYDAAGDGTQVASWTISGLSPGSYEIDVTWVADPNRATNAPYRIYDGTTLLQTVRINQKNAPVGTTVNGFVFQTLALTNITSGTVTITLGNDANGFVIADAVRVVPLPPPVIDLNWTGGGITGPAAASTLSSLSINRTYTISAAPVTTDFMISYYASPDPVFGNADDVLLGSETITAAADKTLGSHTGTSPALTLANRGTYYLFAMLDSGSAILETNETNNVAQAPTQVVVSGPVLVDNGQAGYSEVGAGWTTFSGGFGGNFRYDAAGDGSQVASWTVSGLSPGSYEVDVTWVADPNRATNAPYRIYDGTTLLQTVRINQKNAPIGTTMNGFVFQTLALTNITSGTVRITLGNDSNGFVIADAVRVVPLPPPVIDLNWSGGGITGPATASTLSTFAINRSYAISGAPATTAFTISYYASADATFGNADDILLGSETITAAADMSVGSHTGTSPALTLATRGTYYLFAMLDSGGTILETNETNNVAQAPSQVVASGPVLVDNGQAGYSEVGTGWTTFSGGYGGNFRYDAAGDGSQIASWTISGLSPGSYEIDVTWVADPNRATNAPYRIYDGTTLLQTVRINQKNAPVGTTVNGFVFQTLALTNITSGTVRIDLGNDANGFVIADAVRVVPLPPPVIDLNWSGGGITGPATASTLSTFTINRTYTISGAAATTNFTISYYASTDAVFGNADDVLLGSETITAAADKTVGSHTGTSPALTLATRGTYYLFAMVDSGGAILETNETNNVAQAPAQVVVSGPVIVDNGQAGYSEVGTGWTTFSGGFGGNFRYNAAGDGSQVASWTIGGLSPGSYEIDVTWVADGNRATNAPYRIYDGTTLLQTVRINQKNAPVGTTVNGFVFQTLILTNITNGSVRIDLGNDANGFVIADAVRVVPLPPPVIDLNWSGGGITGPATASTLSTFTMNRTYTISGAPVTTDFTISYYASTDATFGNADDILLGSETITAAADKALGSHTGTSPALTLANRGTYYLFAMLDSGGAILETNETNNVAQAPSQVVVSGPVLVDNGQAGYSEVGAGWTTFSGGYGGNFRYDAAGDGTQIASWTIGGLSPGSYEIDVTWVGDPNRASNAAYRIYDGTTLLQTVRVNQKPAPVGTTVNGFVFQTLAVTNISSGTVRIDLGNDANGFVIADAVRVVPVNTGTTPLLGRSSSRGSKAPAFSRLSPSSGNRGAGSDARPSSPPSLVPDQTSVPERNELALKVHAVDHVLAHWETWLQGADFGALPFLIDGRDEFRKLW